jgi:hypothetical protein
MVSQKKIHKHSKKNQAGGNVEGYEIFDELKNITKETYDNFEKIIQEFTASNLQKTNIWKDMLEKFKNAQNSNEKNANNSNVLKKNKIKLLKILIFFIQKFKIPIEKSIDSPIDNKLVHSIEELDNKINELIDNVLADKNENEQNNLYYGLLVLKTLNYIPIKEKFESLEEQVKHNEENSNKRKENEAIQDLNSEINKKGLLIPQTPMPNTQKAKLS